MAASPGSGQPRRGQTAGNGLGRHGRRRKAEDRPRPASGTPRIRPGLHQRASSVPPLQSRANRGGNRRPTPRDAGRSARSQSTGSRGSAGRKQRDQRPQPRGESRKRASGRVGADNGRHGVAAQTRHGRAAATAPRAHWGQTSRQQAARAASPWDGHLRARGARWQLPPETNAAGRGPRAQASAGTQERAENIDPSWGANSEGDSSAPRGQLGSPA